MSRFLTFIAHYIIVSIILVSLAFSPLAYIQTAHSETRKGNIERLALTKHTTSGIYYVSIPINFNADQEKSYEIYTALSDYLVANNLAYILEVQGPDAMTGSPKLSSSQEFGNLFKAYENSIPSNYSHPDYSPFYTLPDIPNKSVVSPMSVTPALSVIPGEQSVSVWAGNLIFRIINTSGGIMNWTASVTSGSSWLSIADVTAGVNNGTMNEKTIMVRYLQNNDSSPRTAEITVIASGATGSPKIIKITQAGSTIISPIPIKEPQLAPQTSILSVTPSNKNISATDAGNSGFNVTNIGGGTMNWTASITSGSSWLSISNGAFGVNNESITIQYSQNNDPSPRTAEITVIAPGATGSPKIVTITQEGSAIIYPVPNIPEQKATEHERIRRIEADRQRQEDQRKIDEQQRAQEAANEALKRAKNDDEQRIAEEARKKAENARIAAEQEAQKHQQEETLRKAQEEQKQTEEQRKTQVAAEEAKRKEQQPITSASPQISNPSLTPMPSPQSIAQPQNAGNISKPVSQQPSPKVPPPISVIGPNWPVTIKSEFPSARAVFPFWEVALWFTPVEKIALPLIKPVVSTVWKVANTLTKTGTEAVVEKGVIHEFATGLQNFFSGIGEKIGNVFFKNTDEAATVIVSVSKITSKIPAQYDEVAKFVKSEAEFASQNPKALEALNDFASNVAEGGIKTGKGFSSPDTLKKYLGLERMRPNMELHHIVEQKLAGKPFDPTLIHNSANVLVVPKWVNQGLNYYYSSKVRLTSGDQTVRKWLESQTFAEQFRFGVESLEQCFKKELAGCIKSFNQYGQ